MLTKDQIEEKIVFLQEELATIPYEGCECGHPNARPPCAWCESAGPSLLDEIDHYLTQRRKLAAAESLSRLPNWGRF